MGAGLVVSLLIVGLIPVQHAAAAPNDCPEVMPVADVTKGMTGTGLTVHTGTEPQSFNAEVLGVLPDAIGPGRDLIIMNTSGPIIDQVGGIWAGMSGSPIYINDKLVGAVAYGLAWGPSSIAGVTPAEDMVKLLDYPMSPPGATGSPSKSMASKNKASLSSAMRREISNSTGAPQSEVGGSLVTLRTPLSVSGTTDRAMDIFGRAVKRERLRLIPYAGSSARADPGISADPLEAGDSFAGVLSYGDVTLAGTGTTTAVCDDMALAFGHPFFFAGRTALGANHADALTVVSDPAFGSYKLSTVTGGVGVIDQDRLAGLRSVLGLTPPQIPITTSVHVPDLGNEREGTSAAVTSEITPLVAFFHNLGSIDVTFDAIAEGSASASWTITGTRADGSPWELSRSNLYASEDDIGYEAQSEIESHLFSLFYNGVEDVEFTDIDTEFTVEEKVRKFSIVKVLASKNGRPFRDLEAIIVRRGATIALRVILRPFDRSGDQAVDMSVTVPRWVRVGGSIEVEGGPSSSDFEFECAFFGEDCSDEGDTKTFDELLLDLEAARKNNLLIATLRAGKEGGVRWRDRALLDQVVQGNDLIRVNLRGKRRGGGGVKATPSKPGS